MSADRGRLETVSRSRFTALTTAFLRGFGLDPATTSEVTVTPHEVTATVVTGRGPDGATTDLVVIRRGGAL